MRREIKTIMGVTGKENERESGGKEEERKERRKGHWRRRHLEDSEEIKGGWIRIYVEAKQNVDRI